ncbi:MAG: DUF3800 domain-containing protein [Deltaproteobacteria bacterium]|nr:DUF3800 domain-containing protein [Deltaproteobacteria bacterium]
MSYLLFMDESGCDRRESPYEVLAGVCVEDHDLWDLICDVQDKEEEFFGQRISSGLLELKGKKMLKKKVFRHAALLPAIEPNRRAFLAKQCLLHRGGATPEELSALAQAKIAFVKYVLELCVRYHVRAFASIVDRDAGRTERDFLRKDYSYLFERYYNFLENVSVDGRGLVVFDELERSQCHILIDQMSRYFRGTGRGVTRASRIIPEPFFVHSHLTTAIQLADLVAYIVAWAVRIPDMRAPARPELKEFADMVLRLRYRRMVRLGTEEYPQWSFVFIDDLRSRDERFEAGQ